MTATREHENLKLALTALESLVEQYKDDFSLKTEEAELLKQTCSETKRLAQAKNFTAVRDYAMQCAAYYAEERDDKFFHVSETGKKIFTEVAALYLNISKAVKQ
ncbi:MAG: hypothetical protein AABX82_04145 [Nanoarchaeota archaeon]